MRGRGFFSNIGNWFKGAANTVHNFVRNNKLVSKGLALLPHPAAKAAGVAAGLAGYGRRRRVKRLVKRRVGGRRIVRRRVKRRVGGSFRSVLSKAHSFIKSNRLVSRGLSHFGHSKLSNAARSLGYGRRRRTRRRGGSNNPLFNMLYKGVLPAARTIAKKLGYGRRRRN